MTTGEEGQPIEAMRDTWRRCAGIMGLLALLLSLGLAPAAQALSQAADLHEMQDGALPHSEPAHHPAPEIEDGDHCHPGIDCTGQAMLPAAIAAAAPARLECRLHRLAPRRRGGLAPGTDPPVPRS